MTGVKCTNKLRLKFCALLIAGTVTTLSVTGCSNMKNVSDAYQAYQTSVSYGLASSPADSADVSLMGEGLCVGGTSNTDSGSVKTDTAEAAAVFNTSTQKITFSKNIYQRVYPASTTKCLTAYLALKYGNLDDKITVSSTAAAVPAGSSIAGFKIGDRITLRTALYGLLLMSGNDAANIIAEHISGSTSKFAVLMNQEAQKIGATDSHFVNPHGFPTANHYTTVYDMYLIFNKALSSPEFVRIINTKVQTVTYQNAAGKKVTATFRNTNWYKTGQAASPAGYTIIGGKTGSSDSSGYCLVLYSQKEQGDDRMISIIMKSDTKENLYRLMNALLTGFSN